MLTNGIAYFIDEKLEIDVWEDSGKSLRYYVKNADERWKNLIETLFNNFSLKICGGGLNCDITSYTVPGESLNFIFYCEIGSIRLEGKLERIVQVSYDNFPWRSI